MRFQSTAALFALVAIEAATAVPYGWEVSPIPVVEDEVAANPSAISAAPESLYTFPAAKAPKDRVPDISLTAEQLKEIVDLLREAAAPREVAAVDPSAAAAPNAAAPNAAAPNAAAPNAAAPNAAAPSAAAPSAAAGEVAAAPAEVAAAPGEVAAAPGEVAAAPDAEVAAVARSLYDDSNSVVELPTGDLTAAAPAVSKRQSINGVPITVEDVAAAVSKRQSINGVPIAVDDAAAAVSKRQSVNGIPITVEDAVALAKRQVVTFTQFKDMSAEEKKTLVEDGVIVPKKYIKNLWDRQLSGYEAGPIITAKRQTAPAALYYYGQPALSKREIVSQPIPRDIDALNFGKRYITPDTVSAVLPDENVTAAAPVVGNPDENVTAAAPVLGNPDETFVAEITYDGFDGPVKRQTADAFADLGKRQSESPAAAPAVEEVPFGAEA